MITRFAVIRVACLAAGLALAGLGVGCFHHHYRAYDAYYNDYHVWNDHEVEVYQRWARETHRDPAREFRALPPDEQEEYWKWRHAHEDHDKGRKHGGQ